ncbi:MAG: hypothetical protein V3R94_08490 [Acidobacteriota bacterium]
MWTDALLTPGRLSCPRCGAEFRPTVPWAYFRILLLVVVTLAVLVISSFSERSLWMLVFLIGTAVFFWFLPRFIDLQHISDLRVPEGPMNTEPLELADHKWEEKYEAFQERYRFRQLVYLLAAIIVFFLLLVGLGTDW